MTSAEACCTCATLLTDTKVPYDVESEKQIAFDRVLDCCGRTICATCQYENPRFQTYCPFCQISSKPSALPATGLRLPPSYSDANRTSGSADLPPAYETLSSLARPGRTSSNAVMPPEDTDDTVHFLTADDTVASLSLAYKVPAPVIRKHNQLYSDGTLPGRKFVLIPSSHYQGPALSTPPDPEEEERKNKLRRWMVATKCAEYNVAQLYLKGSSGNLEIAIEAFKADEQWEKEHPMDDKSKGKGKSKTRPTRRFGSSLTGQLS